MLIVYLYTNKSDCHVYRPVYILGQTSFKPTAFAILMQFNVMQPYPVYVWYV